jgi:hypothetical protein
MTLDALQWPAMMFTLLAAWFVASRSQAKGSSQRSSQGGEKRSSRSSSK